MLAQPSLAPAPLMPQLEEPAEEQSLDRMAAERMGGPGQMGTGSAPAGQPDYPTDDDVSANLNTAVGEALSRMAGGVMKAPDMTPDRASRRRAQLLKLGVTPFEADLLSRSGGI